MDPRICAVYLVSHYSHRNVTRVVYLLHKIYNVDDLHRIYLNNIPLKVLIPIVSPPIQVYIEEVREDVAIYLFFQSEYRILSCCHGSVRFTVCSA